MESSGVKDEFMNSLQMLQAQHHMSLEQLLSVYFASILQKVIHPSIAPEIFNPNNSSISLFKNNSNFTELFGLKHANQIMGNKFNKKLDGTVTYLFI